MTNFSREKILDVIYKIIAKEPTEVAKWVYFCRKNSRKVVNTDNWSNGNLVTNFSREKSLDVISKIIAKEPTEVAKWVYFCRKNSRKVVNKLISWRNLKYCGRN